MPRKALVLSAVLLAGALAVAASTTLDAPGERAVARAIPPLKHAQRFHPAPKPSGGFTVERVRKGSVALHAKPDGPVIARAGSRTQFGSPQTLAVAARAGGWIGVINEDVSNGRVAWVKSQTRALKPKVTRTALRISLEHRRLELVHGNRVERRIPVGVGGPTSPTPRGRFSITDKLSGSRYGSAYGCCILALSGRQTHTPPGWTGGDRLAIHGTNNPGTIGRRSSAGCLHADARAMRLLMRKVSLGTPVFIH